MLSSSEPESVMCPSMPGAFGATVDTHLEYIKNECAIGLTLMSLRWGPFNQWQYGFISSHVGVHLDKNNTPIWVIVSQSFVEFQSCQQQSHESAYVFADVLVSIKTSGVGFTQQSCENRCIIWWTEFALPVFVPSILCSHFWACASMVPCLTQSFPSPTEMLTEELRQKAFCKMSDLQYVV